jgi:hypothetical protein
MTTKKSSAERKTPADNEKSSPMTYESVNLLPRIVAGGMGESEADVPGLGPVAEGNTAIGEER